MADPVTTLENREHSVKGEKEIRTKGLGFIQCNKHELIKIKKFFCTSNVGSLRIANREYPAARGNTAETSGWEGRLL